jgi:hypothetical protein
MVYSIERVDPNLWLVFPKEMFMRWKKRHMVMLEATLESSGCVQLHRLNSQWQKRELVQQLAETLYAKISSMRPSLTEYVGTDEHNETEHTQRAWKNPR